MNIFFKFIFGVRDEHEKIDIRDIDHAEIIFTEEAIENGSFDDYNKEVIVFMGGVLVKKIPYSIEEVHAIKKVDKIPIWDRTADAGEEFEFEEVEALSGVLTLTREE